MKDYVMGVSGRSNVMELIEFMKDILDNVVIKGRQYDVRIPIDDGGDNSYVSICIDIETYGKKYPETRAMRLFRHTNTVDNLKNAWGFELGGVCNSYSDYPNTAVRFMSYGKTAQEAEAEAIKYSNKLRKLIEKKTSDYEIADAQSKEEERDKLLARLSELQ